MADFFKDRRDIEKELEAEILSRELKVNFSSGSFFDVAYKKPLTNSLAKIWFVLDFLGKISQIDNFIEIVEDENYKNNLAIALGLSFDETETLITTIINTKGSDLGLSRKDGTKAKFNVYFTRAALVAGDEFTVPAGDVVFTRPIAGVTYRFLSTFEVVMLGDNLDTYRAIGDAIRTTLDSQGITDPYALRVECEAENGGTEYNVGSFVIEKTENADFDNVINIEGAIVSGTDQETNLEYLERIKSKAVTSEVGSEKGYKAKLHEIEEVLDVFSVGFNHPLMERDLYAGSHLGAKADIYLLGRVLTRGVERVRVEKDSFIGSTPSDIILENQPVISIVSVEGDSSGLLPEDTSWKFEPDFNVNREKSVLAEDKISFIVSVLDFLDKSITRADAFGTNDDVPFGRLITLDSTYDTPTVYNATPNLTDGTYTVSMDAYPLYSTSPFVAATPNFYELLRVENLTQGFEYDLTDADVEYPDQFILAVTPNIGKPAPLNTDVVQVDYKWKHFYESANYTVTSEQIDWSAGDLIAYGPDIWERRSAPALSQEYFVNYEGEAPILNEYLNIEYRYNALIQTAQTAIEDLRPTCDDVQIRQSDLVYLDMNVDVVSDGTYDDEELADIVSSAVSDYLSRVKLGEAVDQTDILGVVTAIRPDFASTTVRVAVKDLDDIIQVVSTVNFPESGIIYIENEAIEYNSKSSNSFFDLVRGASGTLAVSHVVDLTVKNYFTGSTKSSLGVEKVKTLPMALFKRRITSYVLINSESIALDYISGNTFYISERGVLGTLTAAHLAGDSVELITKVIDEVLVATATDFLTVISTIGFPDTGVITIGTEEILYSYKDKSHFYDLTRGYNATVAAEHSVEDEVIIESTLAANLAASETSDFDVVDGSGFKQGQTFNTVDCTDREYFRAGTTTVTVVDD